MKTEISQPKGKQIMPETWFTEFPELSVDLRVGVSPPASETNVWLFFLPMTIKIIIYQSSFLLFLTFYVAKRPFSERHSVFFMVVQNDVTSVI